jgi:hypothetical protein
MADLALVLDCEVLEGITRTNYDGKESLYLGTCAYRNRKKTVITKKKDFDESASR